MSPARPRAAGVARLGACLAAAVLTAAAPPPLSSAEDETPVVASRSGFRPKSLNLRKGETARLVLTTADEEHCFAVDVFRVEKRIVPGKATILDLTADRAGTFPFYCCLEPQREEMRGRLVVSE